MEGKDLLKLTEDEMCEVRGKKDYYDLSGPYDFPESGYVCWKTDRRGYQTSQQQLCC